MEKAAKLAYHTLFGEEFCGASPEEVVAALYRGSKAGIEDLTYESWWDYQSKLWRQKYGLSIPDRNAPEACRRLLDLMVKIGALESGPIPPQPALCGQKRSLDV